MVTKEILALYDKYEGDFGLLNEPWAKKDSGLVSSEQARVLSSYIDKLRFISIDHISADLRDKTIIDIKELELQIDQDVIDRIKQRQGL